jgi:deoxyribodipyrimidine photo-lyase
MHPTASLGDVPPDPSGVSSSLPAAGERAAWKRVRTFTNDNMQTYDVARNLPGIDTTSRLSADLKYGVVHPRQLLPLIQENPSAGAKVFLSELCWREFYADVLFARPDTVTQAFLSSMKAIETDVGPVADHRFAAWCDGQTGFPFIDAGMRQLRQEGWMHNRVRMATASFLVKDLHLPWQRGAKWFMHQLVDGDVASNQHGWQWTAGTGTDASPYYRVFNPVTQGQKFDVDGTYIRRWIPELSAVTTKAIHEPWTIGGVPSYPAPIVDHAQERARALERYEATKQRPSGAGI